MKELLELSAVPYPVQTESTPTRSWRTCGLSIVKGVMAKREFTMSSLIAFNLVIQHNDFSTIVIVSFQHFISCNRLSVWLGSFVSNRSTHNSVNSSLFPLHTTLFSKSTLHSSSLYVTLHPVSHKTAIKISDACAKSGTICALVALSGSHGMLIMRVCIDLITLTFSLLKLGYQKLFSPKLKLEKNLWSLTGIEPTTAETC